MEAQNLNQLVQTLTEIQTTDNETENFDNISYIINQVFEANKEIAFTNTLSNYIQRKNIEIEKVCSLHYKEFVIAIGQLLQVREGTLSLSNKIQDLNYHVQTTGYKIVEKKKEVIENRTTLINVELAIETIQSCIFVLDTANKVQTRIEGRKYYSALKLLEELEAQLKPLSEFGFVKQMIESIPITQDVVRTAVLREMRDWLVTLKDKARKLGEHSLMSTIKKNQRETEDSDADEMLDLKASNEVTEEAESRVDFTPLHQCFHIHHFLGKSSQLKSIYDENRRLQADDVFQKTFTFADGNLEPFKKYIQSIAGFFIIESIVMDSTREFRSRHNVELLWDLATVKLSKFITESLSDCDNPEMFLGIKLQVVAFTQNMEVYGYNVEGLSNLMVSMLHTYVDLTKQKYNVQILHLLENDEYIPLIVQNEKENDEIKLGYYYSQEPRKGSDNITEAKPKGRNANVFKRQQEFPMELPFSSSLPKVCKLIKQFISDFFLFAEGFNQSNNEMDDLLKKSLESIITGVINGTLCRLISESGFGKIIQVLTNSFHFQKACVMFEDILTEKRNIVRIMLNTSQSFEETRNTAERKILELVCKKIDDFVEIHEYNWLTTETDVAPSLYLSDMEAYICSVRESVLSLLPEATSKRIFEEIFSYLAENILNKMKDPSVKKIHFQFLNQLNADITQLEEFVLKTPQVEDEKLFSELRQFINLMQSDNYEKYLDINVRYQNFESLTPKNLVILMEKFRADSFIFSRTTNEEKVKTKMIDNFLKLLKAQMRW